MGSLIMRNDLLKGLSEEQLEKARACNSSEELLEAAKEEGLELSEEQLEAVSGGCGGTTAPKPAVNPGVLKCSSCGSTNIQRHYDESASDPDKFVCYNCGFKWLP